MGGQHRPDRPPERVPDLPSGGRGSGDCAGPDHAGRHRAGQPDHDRGRPLWTAGHSGRNPGAPAVDHRASPALRRPASVRLRGAVSSARTQGDGRMARLIGHQEIEDIALGAAVLGTGGGGDPYIGKLMAVQSIRECGPVRMVSADEIADDAQVAMAAMMGAPTVMVEKLPSGKEVVDAFLALQAYLGRKIHYTTSAEAGGLNSTIPFTVAARLKIPIVDADGMGRAFPELQMVTPTM